MIALLVAQGVSPIWGCYFILTYVLMHKKNGRPSALAASVVTQQYSGRVFRARRPPRMLSLPRKWKGQEDQSVQQCAPPSVVPDLFRFCISSTIVMRTSDLYNTTSRIILTIQIWNYPPHKGLRPLQISDMISIWPALRSAEPCSRDSRGRHWRACRESILNAARSCNNIAQPDPVVERVHGRV